MVRAIYRFVTGIYFQKHVKFNEASTIFCSSFSKESGWNHLIETLKEYDQNNEINYKDTTMYRFLKNFKPTSISHFVNSDDSLPIFTYPWELLKKMNLKLQKKRIL